MSPIYEIWCSDIKYAGLSYTYCMSQHMLTLKYFTHTAFRVKVNPLILSIYTMKNVKYKRI